MRNFARFRRQPWTFDPDRLTGSKDSTGWQQRTISGRTFPAGVEWYSIRAREKQPRILHSVQNDNSLGELRLVKEHEF